MAMALPALCPFIVLSTATQLFQTDLLHDLRASMFGVKLSSGLSDAGYAFGAVAAADLIKLFRAPAVHRLRGGVRRRLGARSRRSGVVLLTVGRVPQGVVTGMLLVAALPPCRRW